MSMNLEDLRQYGRVIQLSDPTSGLLAYVSIHKLFTSQPSFGATRYAKYASVDLALADAVNLSKLMTYKSVMAGLPYAGAKAVIVEQNPNKKKEVLLAYARFVSQLEKEFITGADIGISQDEVALMKTVAPNNMVGTQLDPVAFTIKGILLAIEETVRLHFRKPNIEGFSFAIQGAGKIGETLLRALYPHASKIYIADVDIKKLQKIKKEFPKIEIVDPGKIYSIKVDFFSPCAMSHSLNNTTVDLLNCRVVLGGANIQLAHPKIGIKLHNRGILYVPDYVVNAGGLISVADEYEHPRASNKRTQEKIKIIPQRVREILEKSQLMGEATSQIADQMADEIIRSFASTGRDKVTNA